MTQIPTKYSTSSHLQDTSRIPHPLLTGNKGASGRAGRWRRAWGSPMARRRGSFKYSSPLSTTHLLLAMSTTSSSGSQTCPPAARRGGKDHLPGRENRGSRPRGLRVAPAPLSTVRLWPFFRLGTTPSRSFPSHPKEGSVDGAKTREARVLTAMTLYESPTAAAFPPHAGGGRCCYPPSPSPAGPDFPWSISARVLSHPP